MVRTHRQAVAEAGWEGKAFLAEHRLLRKQDRRSLSVHRTVMQWPAEHSEALEAAKRMARENLDAHRRALAKDAWLLKLVELYERLQQQRAERNPRRAARGGAMTHPAAAKT